jgi:hypothetical protein
MENIWPNDDQVKMWPLEGYWPTWWDARWKDAWQFETRDEPISTRKHRTSSDERAENDLETDFTRSPYGCLLAEVE